MSRRLAGYSIERSLVPSWLEHLKMDISALDQYETMTCFTHMIWTNFVPKYLQVIAPMILDSGEDVVILVRYFGSGSKYVRENEEDMQVKELLVEHSGLGAENFKWQSLKTVLDSR